MADPNYKTCEMCKTEFEPAKSSARFCSAACRVKFSRNNSVTATPVSVTLSPGKTLVTAKPVLRLDEPAVERIFRFVVAGKPHSVREAKYWYDVPLAAVPLPDDGEPEVPDYMNGRQYFLWWKNEYKMSGESPVLYNPFPSKDNIKVL